MTEQNQVSYELGYTRKFNLGNYQTKDYSIKLSGNEEQVEKQFQDNKQKLVNYLSQLEEIVELAETANKMKNQLLANDKKEEVKS